MPCICHKHAPCPSCGATLLCVWDGDRGECLACGARLYAAPESPRKGRRRRKKRRYEAPAGYAGGSVSMSLGWSESDGPLPPAA